MRGRDEQSRDPVGEKMVGERERGLEGVGGLSELDLFEKLFQCHLSLCHQNDIFHNHLVPLQVNCPHLYRQREREGGEERGMSMQIHIHVHGQESGEGKGMGSLVLETSHGAAMILVASSSAASSDVPSEPRT